MDNSKKIKCLKNIICKNLLPLIDDDYSLIDVPDHVNIGDSLIATGEDAFLKNISYNLLYTCSKTYFEEKNLPKNGIILFHGGGNFGDIWSSNHEFRRKIISNRNTQRIIILPQSVHYENPNNINKDVEVYNQHPDLTICARDNQSYEFLQKHFTKNKILLVPDMAFCLDFTNYQNNIRNNKILFLNRTDKEKREPDINIWQYLQDADKDKDKAIDIMDWPNINPNGFGKVKRRLRYIYNNKKEQTALFMQKTKYLNHFVNDISGLGSKNFNYQLSMKGVKIFNRYEAIYTNRLHGMILAILLDKRVVCLDNSYGKVSSFYNTWLRDFDGCIMKHQ